MPCHAIVGCGRQRIEERLRSRERIVWEYVSLDGWVGGRGGEGKREGEKDWEYESTSVSSYLSAARWKVLRLSLIHLWVISPTRKKGAIVKVSFPHENCTKSPLILLWIIQTRRTVDAFRMRVLAPFAGLQVLNNQWWQKTWLLYLLPPWRVRVCLSGF